MFRRNIKKRGTNKMCLYPKLIKNPKYRPNKKNNYKAPICEDERVLYVPVGCGNCIECRNQKKRMADTNERRNKTR